MLSPEWFLKDSTQRVPLFFFKKHFALNQWSMFDINYLVLDNIHHLHLKTFFPVHLSSQGYSCRCHHHDKSSTVKKGILKWRQWILSRVINKGGLISNQAGITKTGFEKEEETLWEGTQMLISISNPFFELLLSSIKIPIIFLKSSNLRPHTLWEQLLM